MKSFLAMGLVLLAAAAVSAPIGAQDQALRAPFHLAGNRTGEVQYFTMESRLAMHAPDGSITDTDVYRLRLKCTPARIAGTDRDQYTCLGFTVQLGEASEVSIPSLAGFTYLFTRGIPHEPFEGLQDLNAKKVPVANASSTPRPSPSRRPPWKPGERRLVFQERGSHDRAQGHRARRRCGVRDHRL